jgi:23S rRNA (cytidine1920-2'-O)/16S rRNA (cytidine1409-2'-O)-methyltransferase
VAADPPHPYVSRGGLKLRHGLDHFGIDVTGLTCADLGCSTGGFTDCLLQAGAARVISVDTGYGVLAWKLRQDPRVEVHERANALHLEPTAAVDLVVIDLGWTPQRLCIPAALRWLRPGGGIITLIKPHYEAAKLAGASTRGGVLAEAEAEAIRDRTLAELPELGVEVVGVTRSPITGSKGAKRGNVEYLALLRPAGGGGAGL